MIILTPLVRIDLAGHIVRLCGGGTVPWGAETYSAHDDLFGSLDRPDGADEGVGDVAPAGTIRLLPPEEVASADLISAAHQGKRLRFWIGEIDADTGTPVEEPDLQQDLMIDVPRLRIGRKKRVLELSFLSRWQLLMLADKGNTLSSAFHQSVFPGERGFDNATGVTFNFPFGVLSAPRGSASGGPGAGGGGVGVGDRVVNRD